MLSRGMGTVLYHTQNHTRRQRGCFTRVYPSGHHFSPEIEQLRTDLAGVLVWTASSHHRDVRS